MMDFEDVRVLPAKEAAQYILDGYVVIGKDLKEYFWDPENIDVNALVEFPFKAPFVLKSDLLEYLGQPSEEQEDEEG